jgi:hypothetical protein
MPAHLVWSESRVDPAPALLGHVVLRWKRELLLDIPIALLSMGSEMASMIF